MAIDERAVEWQHIVMALVMHDLCLPDDDILSTVNQHRSATAKYIDKASVTALT